MNEYLKMIFTFPRLCAIKYLKFRNIKFHPIERVSLLTTLTLKKKSILCLGKNVCISRLGDVFIGSEGTLKIGDLVYFNTGIKISCMKEIFIGERCLFGPDVKIYDNNHRFTMENGVSGEHSSGKISIGKNCWIGANVIILKDTQIEDNCVIGAGTVLQGFVPKGSLVTSNREIRIEKIK